MIKLTINTNSRQETLSFDQDVIIIGSERASHVDLPLPGNHIQDVHIKISEQDGRYFVLNAADDPFVTINGEQFGKKELATHDILHIGKMTISFDLSSELPVTGTTKTEPSQNTPVEEETAQEEIVGAKAPAPPSPQQPALFPKRMLLLSGLVFICIALLASVIFYARVAYKSDEEKVIAAEGVADVAMALTHAQVHRIKPKKQNWFDPEFLKNNLASVLSSEYPSFANIDNQGLFNNCHYILRIYTSSDLSHYVVIAQPEHSLLQWLAPQTAIAVDSKSMEMRHVLDIKALNRLLINPNSLDATHAVEISRLIKQGELIPLASLGTEKGFAPPKALSLVRPGAENLIYNAPRYYHFGEALLKKAVNLRLIPSNSHEVTRLQQQVEELSKLKNLILYSGQGMQKAMSAQKALFALAPEHKFLIAYLSFNGKGAISSSHLLFDGEYADSLLPTSVRSDGRKHKQPSNETAMAAVPQATSHSATNKKASDIDLHHPLLLLLNAIASERKLALQVISDRISDLLDKHNVEGSISIESPLNNLIEQYKLVDKQYQDQIVEQLTELYREYSDLPLAEFASYVKAANLMLVVKDSLGFSSQNSVQTDLIHEQIKVHFQKVESAKNFAELDKATTDAADLLDLRNLSDAEKLITYQNELRGLTIQQLNHFMFSSKTKLPANAFQLENRAILMHILKTVWITDPTEYGYYLSEFDQLLEAAASK